MADLLRARVTFFAGQRLVNAGDILPASDPVVRRREHLFESVGAAASVEQATAAPGERRAVRATK